jgi:hypothetical protein
MRVGRPKVWKKGVPVTAKFAAKKENVQEGETSANLEVHMDG